MSRKADEARIKVVQETLLTTQGKRASFYAKTLGIHRYDFNTLLAILNDRGFYLWEDEMGRLWPSESESELFERISRQESGYSQISSAIIEVEPTMLGNKSHGPKR